MLAIALMSISYSKYSLDDRRSYWLPLWAVHVTGIVYLKLCIYSSYSYTIQHIDLLRTTYSYVSCGINWMNNYRFYQFDLEFRGLWNLLTDARSIVSCYVYVATYKYVTLHMHACSWNLDLQCRWLKPASYCPRDGSVFNLIIWYNVGQLYS